MPRDPGHARATQRPVRGPDRDQRPGCLHVVAGATSSSIRLSVPPRHMMVSAVNTILGEDPTEEVPPARTAKRSGPTDQ